MPTNQDTYCGGSRCPTSLGVARTFSTSSHKFQTIVGHSIPVAILTGQNQRVARPSSELVYLYFGFDAIRDHDVYLVPRMYTVSGHESDGIYTGPTSLIAGDESISSCLLPFRSRYSMAAKSFLFSPIADRNSFLMVMIRGVGQDSEISVNIR